MDRISKTTKRCPRCERKMPIATAKCPRCGLIFARLSKATNAAGKNAIKNKERNKVIYDSVLPKDVNKWKLFFMSLFLGFFGGHCFYIGKYWRGGFSMIAFLLIAIAPAFPMSWWYNYYLAGIITVCILPAGANVLLWAVDTIMVLCNKYKVPISIDEEYVEDKVSEGTK